MRKDSGLVLNDSANDGTGHYCVGRGAVIFLFCYLRMSALCIAYIMGLCITEPIGRKYCVY